MLQIHSEDPCCQAPLSKALASGALDNAASWECPKCGCEWRPRIVGEGIGAVTLWEPHVYCAIF